VNIQIVLLSLFFIILGAFSTVSIAWLSYKLEWKSLVLFFPLIIILIYFAYNGKDVSIYLSPFIIGIIGGLAVRLKKSFLLYIITSSLLMLIFSSGTALFLKHYKNIDNFETAKSTMLQMIKESEIPKDSKEQILISFESDIEFIKDKVVFLNFLSILFFSLICYSLIKKFFLRNDIFEIKGVEYFKLHDYFIFVLIISWGIFLLLSGEGFLNIRIVALNIALISSVFYFIQAIGVIKFYILKKGWPSYILPMMFVMMLMLGGGGILFFSVLLAGFGSLDLWADFRKLNINTIDNNIENNN
jgi:hypothetical protein